MCLPHLPRIITFNDKVEFTNAGVRFGGFLRVIRELQIGNDGFKSAVILQLKAGVSGCAFSNTWEQEQLAFWSQLCRCDEMNALAILSVC